MSSFATTKAFENLSLKLDAMQGKRVSVNRELLIQTLDYLEFYSRLQKPLAGERDTLREDAYLLGFRAQEIGTEEPGLGFEQDSSEPGHPDNERSF